MLIRRLKACVSITDDAIHSGEQVLARLENDKAMLNSGHFPAPGFGTLVRMEG